MKGYLKCYVLTKPIIKQFEVWQISKSASDIL